MNLTEKIKKWAVIGVIALLALFGLKQCRKVQQKQDGAIVSPILKPTDKGKIIVDPIKRTITTITDKGTTVTSIPDRPVSITEDKNGKITVQSRIWGKELRPYLGVGYDGVGRAHVGADFFYYKKLDLGTGLGVNMAQPKDTTMNVNLSYNVYSNTSIALSYDNRRNIGVFLKVRF